MEQQEDQTDSGLDEESDLENQLEEYMRQGVEGIPRDGQGSGLGHLEVQHAQNKVLTTAMQMPEIDLNKAQTQLDPIFKIDTKEGQKPDRPVGAVDGEHVVQSGSSDDEESDFVQSSSAGSLHTDESPAGKPNSTY